MILIDFNNVTFATILQNLVKSKSQTIEKDLIKHMIINTIRSLNLKFRQDYDNLIIACDSIKYWRREYFPHYKASRKKQREKMNINWTDLFKAIDELKSDLRTFFPYKYIEVEGAEADDIIGTIVKKTFGEEVLIISSDKDYIQLHNKPNVKQYDPVNKRFIEHVDPTAYLFEHIVRGDVGDGVPNIASASNCFVVGERQKKITSKMMDQYVQEGITQNHKLWGNFVRNQTLIDLNKVPQEIKDKIEKEFFNEEKRSHSHLMNYFIKNKMKILLENINDF